MHNSERKGDVIKAREKNVASIKVQKLVRSCIRL